MVLLCTKQASEPSPKLIIVATHTHSNNGGPGIAMLHVVADPVTLDGPVGALECLKEARFGQCVTGISSTAACQASLRNLSKAIIVATHTHGNNGGPGIAMLHVVAHPVTLDGPVGVLDCLKEARFGQCVT